VVMRIRVHRCPALVAALGLILAGGALSASNAFASEGEPCPNAQLRQESNLNQLTGRPYSTELPDCRAYEQVTPVEKGQGNVHSEFDGPNLVKPFQQAAANGEAIMYGITNAFPDERSAQLEGQEAAFRGAGGWLDVSLSAPFGGEDNYTNFSANLSCATDETVQQMEVLPSGALAPLPSGETVGEVQNLYVWNSAAGTYTLVSNVNPANRRSIGEGNAGDGFYQIYGMSEDCSRIVFATEYQLLAGAPEGGDALYEWNDGVLQFASRLPDQTVIPVTHLPSQEGSNFGAVSPNGSRVVFSGVSDSGADAGLEEVFMREGEHTTEVSQSQTTAPDEGSTFEAGSTDGSHVLFIASYGLTAHSSSAPGTSNCTSAASTSKCDLYDYDVETHSLTDISADMNTSDAQGADVGGVLGLSPDGSYVYFSARGQLPASNGAGSASERENEAHTEENVYLSHNGQLSYVATLTSFAIHDNLLFRGAQLTSRVASGPELLFSTIQKLTAYDNTRTEDGGTFPTEELYLYSAQTEKFECVSCDPDGARPLGEATSSYPGFYNGYAPRNLSSDGNQVFFTSADPLAAGATAGRNGYEWEREGTGDCSESEAHAVTEYSGGCIFLLAPGGSVLDASSNGDDVFVTSRFSFVAQDTDGEEDLYDVRVNGGFPAPMISGCVGEECQGEVNGPLSFSHPGSTGVPLVGNSPPLPETKTATKQTKPKELTKAQKLANALKSCEKKAKKKRAACEKQARKKYGAKVKGKAKNKNRKSSGKGSK
jgi:hypothetical protein